MMTNEKSNRKSPNLLKSVVVFGGAMVLAKFSGFAREIVLAAFYGAGTVSDAFILAFTIPDSLLGLVGASVAACFIPMYHRTSDKARFVRNIMTCLLIIGLLFSVIFALIPGALVRFFAFNIDSEVFELAVFFVRYMVWAAIFMLLMGIYGAKLEIEGAFFSSGTRSVWRNGTIILGLVLGALFNNNLFIALAPVAGSALAMVVMAAVCQKQGYAYRPYLDMHSPELKQVLILSGPILLSKISNLINIMINRNFAATLPEGTISHLHYASKIATLIAALFGYALSTVLYPHMSRLVAEGNMAKLKDTITRGIMQVLGIMIPLCICLFVLAQPGVRILFQRGSFTVDDTVRTAANLRMYALLVLANGLSPLLLRAFFAVQNTKVPAAVSFVAVLVSLVLSFVLIEPLGAEGLALAVSLSGLLTACLLFVFLRKKLGAMGLLGQLPEMFKICLASGIVGIGIWFAASALPLMSIPVWQSVILCAILMAVTGLFYFFLMIIMKCTIAFEVIHEVARLLKRKKSNND